MNPSAATRGLARRRGVEGEYKEAKEGGRNRVGDGVACAWPLEGPA